MYLGEILRKVLLRMAEEAFFFGNEVPPKLGVAFVLRCVYIYIEKVNRFHCIFLEFSGVYLIYYVCVYIVPREGLLQGYLSTLLALPVIFFCWSANEYHPLFIAFHFL